MPRSSVIPNGVDTSLFRIHRPIHQRSPKVLWVGSEHFRILKGYDEIIAPLQNILKGKEIPFDFRLVDSFAPNHKLTMEEMPGWYNEGTILLCASRSEGTPNPALEAAACGCTVVSTPVGNMPDLIRHGENGYLVERDVRAFSEAIESSIAHYPKLAAQLHNDVQAVDWKRQAKRFYDRMQEVLEEKKNRSVVSLASTRLDLRDKVTVFVTTVGANSLPACLRRIWRQDCTFSFKLLDRMAPMSRAFQQMLEECSTPYYIQVDEDMLLRPYAIRTLYDRMHASASNVALFVANLFDLHLNRCIQGVKIYRHKIVKHFPYRNTESCEKAQVKELEKSEFVVEKEPLEGAKPFSLGTLGLHGTHYTPQTIYERYLKLERCRQRVGMEWVRAHHDKFLKRFEEDPCELNFFALMGICSGVLMGGQGDRGEKDFRTYDTLPGYQLLKELYRQLQAAHGTNGHVGGTNGSKNAIPSSDPHGEFGS